MSVTTWNELVSGAPTLRAFDTCHSTWLFDEENRRFRRVLRNVVVGGVSTEWRPYDRLVVEPACEAFVLVLDPRGTRILRGRRCGSGCDCEAAGARAGREAAPTLVPLAPTSGGWGSGTARTGADDARIIPLPLPLPLPVARGARAGVVSALRR